jgi:hypothetical protein
MKPEPHDYEALMAKAKARMTPRDKAWFYLLDAMRARFGSGDIGGGQSLADEAENEKVCEAGIQLVRDLHRQGPPKERS